MSVLRPGPERPPFDPVQHRIQREHELSAALDAARLLQNRLEMLGDRRDDVRFVRDLRDELAGDIGRLAYTSRLLPPGDDGGATVPGVPADPATNGDIFGKTTVGTDGR